ncbi:kinetochore protein 1 extragenic suppressor [Nannizzia gypsea CBS 118893]|uniref:Kinetochore protein 1 extragenic suppressor n=1 Tax=Arthroderma gypseum (strain ATCC MYA-4604 / CBS 118893) TaxID=535722 RepID=E4V1D5_ARTGP|nr:kinetochore protein 1 extragenic suppressor [Nannizzia gypsea CBS 118893]EFR03850.1 kinetochore protein 1 extragenic suppressor [Nannizzia gypsea CBS 118893]
MFWKYGGYANVSPITTLLDKPDVRVEEILDESDLMQEIKQHNTRLIEYLRDDHVLKRLFELIISPSLLNNDDDGRKHNDYDNNEDGHDETTDGKKEPESPESSSGEGQIQLSEFPRISPKTSREPKDLEEAEKNRLKYAYIASEVLSSPSWSVIEAMVENEDALRCFWQYMYRPGELDSVQTSYFVKVNEVLLDQKTDAMIAFIMRLDNIIQMLLQHVDNPLVMDLVLKIITLDKIEEQNVTETQWLQSQNLIPTFLSYISNDHPPETQTAAGDLLKAIVTISANAAQNEQPCIGPNSLTRQLVSKPCIRTLISSMVQGGNPLTVGVGIIIDIIRKNNPDYDPEMAENRNSTPTTHDPIYLGTMLKEFASHVPQFMELMNKRSRPANSKLDTAWGETIEPLGFDRFKTCELMAELLHCSNMCLHNEPGSHGDMLARDLERERLRALGFPQNTEDGFVYADSINGTSDSRMDTTSPEESKRRGQANTGEEEAFEEITSSGVLVDRVKGSESPAGCDTKPTADNTFTNVPKLGQGDDFVDEPLTPPKLNTSKKEPPTAGTGSDAKKSVSSSIQSDLTEKVDEIHLNKEGEAMKEPESVSKPSDTPAPEPTAGQSASTDTVPPSSALTTPETTPTLSEEGHPHPSHTDELTLEESKYESDPFIQREPDGKPVVGDYMKIMFHEHKVVPTVLSYFFRFPWNNFLHNVVYDIVQQLLNGLMEQGFNRTLVIDLFESAEITTQIIQAQRRSEESEAKHKMRLGNMGHLTLIAEEVVKFSERHPREVLSPHVMEKLTHADWIDYVEHALSDTRERENAILGGVKPDITMSHRQAVLNAISAPTNLQGTSSALADAGLNGGFSSGFSLNNLTFDNQSSASGGAFGFSSNLGTGTGTGTGVSLFSGFGSDDDDEDMEDRTDHRDPQSIGAGLASIFDNSETQPIPILPPPPAPLSTGPSRARRQLAARLALQKQQALDAAAANNEDQEEDGFAKEEGEDSSGNAMHDADTAGDSDHQSSSFSGFQDVSGYSDSSSDEDGSLPMESVERKFRLPVDAFDDDDEMGDMVGPSTSYSDEDDETIIQEALGYSTFLGSDHHGLDGSVYPEERELTPDSARGQDNSDGEDDGLVEILVPGKRSVTK